MTQNTKYSNYPLKTPTKDDYYLVSVKKSLMLKLGLQLSPCILIANFNPITQKWTTVLNMQGVGDITEHVISWCELPRPKPEVEHHS